MLEWLIALTVVNVLLVGLGSILLVLMHTVLTDVQSLAKSWEATAQPAQATGQPMPGTTWLPTDRELAQIEQSLESDSHQRAAGGWARSRHASPVRKG